MSFEDECLYSGVHVQVHPAGSPWGKCEVVTRPFLRPCCWSLAAGQACPHLGEVLRVCAKPTMVAGKQNLNGLSKCSPKWQFCTLFYLPQSKEEA